EQACAAFGQCVPDASSSGIALLAVGGFGRRELYPYSDVDVCILVENDKSADQHRAGIQDFIQQLWDLNLRVSQSVRTIQECCEVHDQNIELNISLLDQRYLAGDHSLYERLEPKLARFFETQHANMARHLCRLARKRHSQYNDTIYHLEPNIKEAPGGLRDL